MDKLAARYGRRGTWLIVLGVVWVLFGVGLLLQPVPARPWVLNEYVPAWVNAFAWVLSGAVAIGAGLRGSNVSDAAGHVALYVMPAVRLVCFTFSWLLWVASTGLHAIDPSFTVIGWRDGWYAALVWSLVSLMLRLIADWPNPSQVIPRPPSHAGEGR